MAQNPFGYFLNPFERERERELAARLRKEISMAPGAMSSPFQNEFDRQAAQVEGGRMSPGVIPGAVPGSPAGRGVSAAAAGGPVPYGMTPEQFAALSDDTSAERARAAQLSRMGMGLLNQKAPTGRSVGPSNIYVQNPWEGLASGIEKGLGGYLVGRGRKDDAGLDDRDKATRDALVAKGVYTDKQADEAREFDRMVARRKLKQADAALAQSVAAEEGKNLRSGVEMVYIDPKTNRPDFTKTKRAMPDAELGFVWQDKDGGAVDQSQWIERKSLSDADFQVMSEGDVPTALETGYFEDTLLLDSTNNLLNSYDSFTDAERKELDKVWSDIGVQALETMTPNALTQRLDEMSVNSPKIRDFLLQGQLYSADYRKSKYGQSQTGGESSTFAKVDPFVGGVSPQEIRRRLNAHRNAYDARVTRFRNLYPSYNDKGEMLIEELPDGSVRIGGAVVRQIN